MTKDEWIKVINERQDMYVNQLCNMIEQSLMRKEIFFNSPTGTGKTIMVAKLVNMLESKNYFFLITTLSRGGLNQQIEASLKSKITNENFFVFGVSSYTKTTKLQSTQILEMIPSDKKLIWIRDEGHIKSNNWTELLEKKSFKIINVSATNKEVDIQCNFSDTPLLRTPYQMHGTPTEAIDRLIKVKLVHQNVPQYNPCLIVRDVSGVLVNEFVSLCNKYHLKYIDITENNVDVQELSKNDNEYDVIINKMKITEGIDIPRANVIYIGNRPSNDATTIQLIGRVRRNALLWHDGIDIFEPNNKPLLEETTKTYVYYQYDKVSVATTDGELCMELSDTISVEQILLDEVYVEENRLANGYKIAELEMLSKPYTGKLQLSHENDFVTITNIPELYKKITKIIEFDGYKYKEIVSDKELIQVSFDKTKYYKQENAGKWRITKTVSDNILYGKLKSFLEFKYQEELSNISNVVSNDKEQSTEKMQRKNNAALTYLVEYYLKYLLFGESYLYPYYDIAKHQFEKSQYVFTELDLLLYALSLMYKNKSNIYYGTLIGRMVPAFSIDEIMVLDEDQKKEIEFKAHEGLKLLTRFIKFDDKPYSTYHLGNAKILHGVASILTKNKIILFSNSGHITKKQIYKGLAYHFLSTKRFDLQIDEICLYDFKSAEFVAIPIMEKNKTKLKYLPPEHGTKLHNKHVFETFSFDQLKSYYSTYGKLITLEAIGKQGNILKKSKTILIFDKKANKTKKTTQKRILNIAMETKDYDVVKKLLECMLPSKDTLYAAILTKNFPIVERDLLCVKPTVDSLMIAIKGLDFELVQRLVPKVKVDFKVLNEAIKQGDEEIVEYIADKINVTKYNANDIIRTQYIPLIQKLVVKIKPTPYNLKVAIDTGSTEVVQIISKKMKVIPNQCLEYAYKVNHNMFIFIKNIIRS